MSTPKIPAMPGPLTIPLSSDIRQAYEDLAASIETAIETTKDTAVLDALNPMKGQVDDVLTKDDMYKLEANTKLFNALQQQIRDTNQGLQKLQQQIGSIAAGFSEAGQVLGAVNKVLTLIPGI
jgi:uncharacterized protein YaaN involved in tellurite resistance